MAEEREEAYDQMTKRELRFGIRAILFHFAYPKINVLMALHKSGRLLLPGGGMDYAEAKQEGINLITVMERQTLWRELREELGMTTEQEHELKSKQTRLRVGCIEWVHDDHTDADLVVAIGVGNIPMHFAGNPQDSILSSMWIGLEEALVHPRTPNNIHRALVAFNMVLQGQKEADYGWS